VSLVSLSLVSSSLVSLPFVALSFASVRGPSSQAGCEAGRCRRSLPPSHPV
jgi:hypothetical protein